MFDVCCVLTVHNILYKSDNTQRDGPSKNAVTDDFKYEGDSKSNGKIHLTALIEVTVSNFTYHFST